MSADATFGQMSQFLIIIIDVIRFMLGFLGVVYVAQKHEVAYYDVNVRFLLAESLIGAVLTPLRNTRSRL